MGKRIEYTAGDIIGVLTFIQEVCPSVLKSGVAIRRALFTCPECGNVFESNICNAKSNNTRSCGCLGVSAFNDIITTHGLRNHKLYSIWSGIKSRCYRVNDISYARYGGRGITVCDEWRDDFRAFHDHVITLPNYGKEGYTLDRENNDKGYYPGNVRWSDGHTQNTNQRMKGNNTSGYTGVYKRGDRWRVSIAFKYKYKYLGSYTDKYQAIDARNEYIIKNNLPHKIQEYAKD